MSPPPSAESESKEISLEKHQDRMQESQESVNMYGDSTGGMSKDLEVLMLEALEVLLSPLRAARPASDVDC